MNNQNFKQTSIKFAQVALATTTVLMTAAISPALANKVEILGADYGGNGCPGGSANVSVSPDGQELTILFDKFMAQGNNAAERRKSCNMSIPIKVPQGFQISFYDADYRGYVAPNTTGTLRAEYFFAGQRGPVFSRKLRGETDYNITHKLATVADVWSRCGDSVNMRVNAAMTASGQGMATVDSFDLAHRGLVYHMKYRKC
jgi:GTPase involved in cell partitioning and DNA repair